MATLGNAGSVCLSQIEVLPALSSHGIEFAASANDRMHRSGARASGAPFAKQSEETIMKHVRTVFVLAAATLFSLSACSGSGGSSSGGLATSPSGSAVRLAGADILIGGQSVSGATIPQGAGPSTLFTTMLVDPADTSRIRTMYMDYPAHSSMGMMGYTDRVPLYDDGTHGDLVPGDGKYSYMDVNGHVGPDYSDCPRGDYIYTFHGTDIAGHDTNSIDCRVTVR